MIEIKVTESLPTIAPMGDLMAKLARQMETDVLGVVETGRDWTATVFPGGRATLGYIKRNLKSGSTEDSATVSWSSDPHDPRVAFVHEFGATINITDKMRRFFLYKFIQTGERFWLSMRSKNKTQIHIPARSVIPRIEENAEAYAEFIGRNVIIESTKRREN